MNLVESEVQLPVAAGVEGFIRGIREVLRIPRVRGFAVDMTGKLRVTRHITEAEEGTDKVIRRLLEVNFDDLLPSSILQHIPLECLSYEHEEGAPTLASLLWWATQLLFRVDSTPDIAFAFVAHQGGTVERLLQGRTKLLGVPVLFDPGVPNDRLLVFTVPETTSTIQQTRHVFGISLP